MKKAISLISLLIACRLDGIMSDEIAVLKFSRSVCPGSFMLTARCIHHITLGFASPQMNLRVSVARRRFYLIRVSVRPSYHQRLFLSATAYRMPRATVGCFKEDSLNVFPMPSVCVQETRVTVIIRFALLVLVR